MKIKWQEPALIAFVVAVDRLTKAWVLGNLYGQSKPVLSFFRLSYVENTGVAFGMFHDSNAFFTVFSALLIAGLLVYRRKFPARGRMASIGLSLVIGGALGNLYDRLAYGFVVDFLDFSFFPAVFNAADSAITVGAVLLAPAVIRETPSKGG